MTKAWLERAWRLLRGVLERLSRVPPGVWAALGTAVVLLELHLRGRRLDAELAQVRLRHTASQVREQLAQNAIVQERHRERIRVSQHRIYEIERARALAATAGAENVERLRKLPADKVHAEYMKLVMKKWDTLGPTPTFGPRPPLGLSQPDRETLRPRSKDRDKDRTAVLPPPPKK